jgi:hypothetical protein
MAQNLDPSQKPDPMHPAPLPASGGDLGDWLSGAWNTYSGKTAFSTPENVYNPMANYNPDPSQQARGQQMLSQQYYANALNGRNPSLANEQMRQGIAQGQHQQMAAASGSRGIDRAAAFRQAQNNAAQMGAQGAIAGGQQRLQEQQQAASGLQQGAGQMRQQDVGEQLGLGQLQNQAQANLNKQYEIDANVQSGNAARQQNASGNLVAAAGAALGGLFSDIRSKENISPLGDFYSSVGMPSQAPAAEPDNYDTKQSAEAPKSGGGMDSMMGGMALGSMLSDRDSKENLSSVHGYKFDYRDPDAERQALQAAQHAFVQTFMDAKQPREGVMAQDLAQNPATSPIVQKSDENNRLMLDGKRALGFILANMGDLNDRLSRVEGGQR